MIETIILVLVVLWLLGSIFFSGTAGSYIHLLLVVALGALVVRFFSGRKSM